MWPPNTVRGSVPSMFRIGIAAVSFALVVSACAGARHATTNAPSDSGREGVRVTLLFVLDGDSIEVSSDGETEEVRLLGINAPEGDECFGDQARDALINIVDGHDLFLVEGADAHVDRYGRLLRYVYVGGENVNGRLLADGTAVALQGDHRHNDSFVEIGTLAAEAGHGMWAPDACGPAATIGPAIDELRYNPPGPDDEHLDDEYATIVNAGIDAVDLTDWILRDESSQNRFQFAGVVLEPGDRVTVTTGCGSDRADRVYWCAHDPVWSNAGDTAILQDGHGNVVDRWMYTN